MSIVTTFGPSNIALIKYMGKQPQGRNLPENPSVSMTLSRLGTWVETRPSLELRWSTERPVHAPAEAFSAPDFSSARFLDFARFLIAELPAVLKNHGFSRAASAAVEIRSANTLPAAAGVASSASSFSALTLALAASLSGEAQRFGQEWKSRSSLMETLSGFCRQGSGSACRSLSGPWVAWEDRSATGLDSKLEPLTDLVVVISREAKAVSSSEAHRRVKTSPEWKHRPEHARLRASAMRAAIAAGDLAIMSRLADEDWKEMHALFSSASEPFSYLSPASHEIAERAKARGALVTFDAGPNPHLLVPTRAASDWREWLAEHFSTYEVLEDRAGTGAQVTHVD